MAQWHYVDLHHRCFSFHALQVRITIRYTGHGQNIWISTKLVGPIWQKTYEPKMRRHALEPAPWSLVEVRTIYFLCVYFLGIQQVDNWSRWTTFFHFSAASFSFHRYPRRLCFEIARATESSLAVVPISGKKRSFTTPTKVDSKRLRAEWTPKLVESLLEIRYGAVSKSKFNACKTNKQKTVY